MSYALNSLYKGMPKHRRSRCSSGPLNEHRSLLLRVGYFDGLKMGSSEGFIIKGFGQVCGKKDC